MKPLDEIRLMMAAGNTAQADEALKELLANEPDNLQAKMLYGTCRQLLGDEETFKRIHDELAPVVEKPVKDEPKVKTVSLWKKYHVLWISLIVGGLILAGVCAGFCLMMIRPASDFVNVVNVHDMVEVPVKGRYVTGCGCCDKCTGRHFERDDIMYERIPHPGKCTASLRECTCPCIHNPTPFSPPFPGSESRGSQQ